MRTILMVTALAACVHNLQLTPQEQCGVQGLVADGVSYSSGTGNAVAYGKGGPVYAQSTSFGQDVQCRRPQSPKEQCEAQIGNAGGQVKLGYEPFWRNVTIFIGYWVFVIPGIVASVGFISGEGSRDHEADLAETSASNQCFEADQADAPHGEPPDRSPQQVPVEDEQQTPAQRKIVVGDAPLWCTAHAANLMSGNCEKTKEMCETMRAQLGSGDLGECVALGAVACFNYTDVMSNARNVVCTPSISDCDKQLAWDREHFAKDWKVSASECGIYRVKDAGSGGE